MTTKPTTADDRKSSKAAQRRSTRVRVQINGKTHFLPAYTSKTT